MRRSIVVTNNFKGYHKYEQAPENVAFLRTQHRHVFNMKTTIEVFHNERDIEFFQLQDELENFVKFFYNRPWEKYVDGIYIGSCESLAEKVINYLHEKYPKRHARVEVWEDNENGAIVED